MKFFFLGLTGVAEIVVAHLERHLDGGRPVVRIETPVQPLWCDAYESLGEVNHWLVGKTGKHGVFELLGLLVDGFVNARVGMPEEVDPPGTDRIDVAVAVEIMEPDALAALERNKG